MTWLPGSHDVEDSLVVPADVVAGSYSLDVAILSEDGAAGHVQLAIDGVRSDLWYPVSTVTIE